MSINFYQAKTKVPVENESVTERETGKKKDLTLKNSLSGVFLRVWGLGTASHICRNKHLSKCWMIQ